MKLSALVLFLCIGFSSCTDNKEAEVSPKLNSIIPTDRMLEDPLQANSLPGKALRMVKIHGNLLGQPLTGSAMAYQQSYVFLKNDSCRKVRTTGADSVNVFGTYSVQSTQGEDYLVLSFSSSSSNIIESCDVSMTEWLWIRTDTVQSSGSACDWPLEQYVWQK